MQKFLVCRVIFDSVNEVYACLARLQRSKSIHRIIAIDDRVCVPKESGYRGIHVVFSCYDHDSVATSPWKKHKIEVQLRTRMQHAWATCVEMIDIFEKTRLKTRLTGDDGYRRFFKLAARLMAAEMVGYSGKGSKKLDGQMLISLKEQRGDDEQLTVSREYFAKSKARLAVEAYNTLENDPGCSVVVLVSVKSVEDLKKAYPNYFVDSSNFVKFYLNQTRLLTQGLTQQADHFKSQLEALQKQHRQ